MKQPGISTRCRGYEEVEADARLDLVASDSFRILLEDSVLASESLLQLPVQPVHQTSPHNDLGVTVIERQTIETQELSVNALGASAQADDRAGS